MSGILGTGGGSGIPAGMTIALQETAPNLTTGVLAITAATTTAAGSLALVPKGAGTLAGGALLAQVPDATAAAGNVRGANAVDWQTYRVASTQVASGAYAVIAGGTQNAATGQFSFVAGGTGAVASTYGKFAMASGSFASPGDAQFGCTVLRGATVAGATARLTADGNAAGSTNICNLPNNSAYLLKILLAATDTAHTTGLVAEYSVFMRRGANAASTVLVATTQHTMLADAAADAASVALTADTSNGGIDLTVTGIVASNLRWVATIQTTEVG